MKNLDENALFLSSNVMKMCDTIITDDNHRWREWQTENNKFIIVNKSNKESASKKAVFPSNPSKGMSEWKIRFRKKGTNFTESITVNRSTTHTTRGGGIEINWG